jgi:hypothetical protein
MENENKMEPSEVSKKGKIGHWTVHAFYVVAMIVILFFVKNCIGNKHEAEKNAWKLKEMISTNDSIRAKNKYDSLANKLNLQVNKNNLLAKKCDSLMNVNTNLKNRIYELNNRKAILDTTESTDGNLVKAKLVSKNVDGLSELFFKKQKPCEKFESYCLTDPYELSITEKIKDVSNVLKNFQGYRSFPIGNDPNIAKSCVVRNEPVLYSFSTVRYKVDEGLLRSSKIKNFAGIVLRSLGMVGETLLRHSRTDLAVTANGISPYEKGNLFLERNLSDRRDANLKKWGEVGAWTIYLGGEALNSSARHDQMNAYSSEQVTYILNLNWNKK